MNAFKQVRRDEFCHMDDEDRVDVWGYLLNWVVASKLPALTKDGTVKQELLLIRSQLHDDKFIARSFQHEVMMHTLLIYNVTNTDRLEIVKIGVLHVP